MLAEKYIFARREQEREKGRNEGRAEMMEKILSRSFSADGGLGADRGLMVQVGV